MKKEQLEIILGAIEKDNPNNYYINNNGLSQLGALLFYPKDNQKEQQKELLDLLSVRYPDTHSDILRSLKLYHFTSYYTPKEVIDFQINILKNNGISPKRILEPSAGNGAYVQELKHAFPDAEIVALEPDILSYNILNTNNIHFPKVTCLNTTFEDYYKENRKEPKFDLVISNVPFGQFTISKPFLHPYLESERETNVNLFFNKYASELLNHNGYSFILTSKGFMDNANNSDIRRDILMRNDLISAVRFNNELFKTEKTSVTTDLILYRHNGRKESLSEAENLMVHTGFIELEGQQLPLNNYYKENPKQVHGSYQLGYFNQKPDLTVIPSDKNLGIFLAEHSNPKIPTFQSIKEVLKKNIPEPIKAAIEQTAQPGPVVKRPLASKEKYVLTKPERIELETNLYTNSFNLKKDGTPAFFFSPTVFKTVTGRKEIDIVTSYIQVKNQFALLYHNSLENLLVPEELKKGFASLNYEIDRFHFQSGYLADFQKLLALDFYYDTLRTQVETLLPGDTIRAIKNENFSLSYFEGLGTTKSIDNPDRFPLPDYDRITDLEELVYTHYDQKATIEMDFLVERTGLTKDVILERGLKEKIFYYDPKFDDNGKFLEFKTDLYFVAASGHIPNKIEAFKNQALPEGINQKDIIDRLEFIQNPKLDLELIEFNFETFFVPDKARREFLKDLIGEDVQLLTTQSNSSISLVFPRMENKEADIRYSVKKDDVTLFDYKKLLQKFAENKYPTVYRSYKDEHGNTVRVIDKDATLMAHNLYEQVQLEFKSFIHNSGYKEELENTYYDHFLAEKIMETSPKVLRYANSLTYEPYDHQKAGTLFSLMRGSSLIDHKVGHGKTLTMGMLAYKLSQHSKAEKTFIITLKSVSDQLYKEIKINFPQLNVFLLTDKNFAASKRNQTLEYLKNNTDVDLVIGQHTHLQRIPKDMKYVEHIFNKKLDMIELDLENAKSFGLKESKKVIKGLVQRQQNLENKLAKKIDKNQKLNQHTEITLSDLGIESIMIDEAHKFKNIGYTTRHNNVSGLNNSADNDTNLDLEISINSIHDRVGADKNIFFFSGTPIKNSVTELYAYQRYLIPNELEQKKISNFDSWASIFLKQSIQAESDVFGNARMHSRFRYYTNMPEISKMYHSFTHISNDQTFKTTILGLKEDFKVLDPTVAYDDLREASRLFGANKDELALFSEKKYSDEALSSSYILALGINRRCLVDPMIEEGLIVNFTEDDQIKINALCEDVAQLYNKTSPHKGVCLIFSDIGVWNAKKSYNTYDTIKNKLQSLFNVPAEQIGFAQEFQSRNRLHEFQEKLRNGDIRIAIGSTATLGTGTNVQRRAVGVFELDIPYSPDASEQRLGRALRKGNEIAQHYGNDIVHRSYGIKNTTDIFSYSLNKHKQLFRNQLKAINQKERIYDDLVEKAENLSYAQKEAALIGDLTAFKLIKLEEDFRKLDTSKKLFDISINNADSRIEKLCETNTNIIGQVAQLQLMAKSLDGIIPNTEFNTPLAEIQQDTLDAYRKHIVTPDFHPFQLLHDPKDAFEALANTINLKARNFPLKENEVTLFKIGRTGCEFVFKRDYVKLKDAYNYRFGIKGYNQTVYGNPQYRFSENNIPFQMFKVIKNIDDRLKTKKFDIKHNLETISSNKKILGTTFPEVKVLEMKSLEKEIKTLKRQRKL